MNPAERDALTQQLEEAQQRLLSAPPETIVANHCFGLFELAAMYLSADPPRNDGARLAIDALTLLVEGLGERLGPSFAEMKDALAHLQIAFVQSRPPGDGAGST